MKEPEQLTFDFMKEPHDGCLSYFRKKQGHRVKVLIPNKNRVIYL